MMKKKRDCLDLIEQKGLELTIQKIGGVERLIGPGTSVAVPVTSWDKLYETIDLMPARQKQNTGRIEIISLIGKNSAEREQIALKLMADYQAAQERKAQRDTEKQPAHIEEKPSEHAEEN